MLRDSFRFSSVPVPVFAAGLGLFVTQVAGGVASLAFVSGSVETHADGSEVFFDSGDVFIISPMNGFSSGVSTDQGFAEVVGRISVGAGVSVYSLTGSATGSSFMMFDLVIEVPEATTFQIDDQSVYSYDAPSFEALTGLVDFDNGTISAGTYRVTADSNYDFFTLSWALILDGEFRVVPVPGTVGMLGVGLCVLGRRRRAGS